MPPSSSSSITRRLQLVFAVSILILILSSTASFVSNRKLIDASYWVNHTNEVIINAESLISMAKDAETGQRGYIITNDVSFLQPYTGAYEKALTVYNRLRQLTLDNPVQQRNLDHAKMLIEQRFEQMRSVLEQNAGTSLAERTQLFRVSREEMLKGKLVMDELRSVVDQIKAEEQRLLKKRTTEQEAYTRYTPIFVVIAALLSILLSVVAYLRIRADLEERIRKQKEDEEKYIETSRRISVMESITHQIASGNYSVRSLDEAQDELGRIATALNEMATALEHSFNDLERRNWLQAGTLRLNNAVRGERLLKAVADKIVGSIAEYLNAPLGTLYVVDQDQNLGLQGSYAVTNAPKFLRAGQGLLGQALVGQQAAIVDQLPPDYVTVSSSIGYTVPTHTLIVPLLYGNEVVCVLELGFLRRPEAIELEYIQNNAESIAVSIRAAINHERMQDLLEETQAQAEELQSQHNELESINTELEAQTEKLQASEEELKVQQEELQQANQELEEHSRMLEERNLEILEKNREVQRKAEELTLSTRYKSEFLANMSHELRTPLNSILLLSRLLSENNEHNLSGEQVEYARVIQSSGNGLLALIDEILDLSKIEAGKMELEYEPVPLSEIIQDVRSLFEPVAREKQLDFNISIAEDVPQSLETDKLRLEQVLKNLLSNALKFTAQGRVGLEVRLATDPEGYLSFAVTDTGIGIPPEKQQQIFEAFQQADGSTRRKYGGTGLGLSISKELIKLLGGQIELHSEAGRGSRFTILVPCSPARIRPGIAEEVPVEMSREKAPVAALAQPVPQQQYLAAEIPERIPDDRASVAADDKVILIVEDDTVFARSLLEFTRKKGYKGIVSVRGDEGLALALQYCPLGILLDIQLPVKSGWEVMEELKNNPKTRHIPVHIMSSYSVKKESLLKGAIDFINKPMAFEQMQEVFEKLEHVLNRTSRKVLIVEDNPKHARALAYFLETFDINSEVKDNIPEGIEALKNDADCVILDMGIPDQKAYDTLEEVKKNPGLENLPIIIFTGKSLSLSEEQRIKQYADSIVVKTAHSYQRILDEISLFLHLVEEQKPRHAGDGYRRLGALNDVLRDKTVLIVDDDVRNIFSLSKSLEKVNMNIITAIDGKEAMQRLQEHRQIDVVLLDMMMPEMDGYETARRIRRNPEWKNLPVIAVTAKAMMGDRDKCIKAGASDYITKPVDVDQLLSLLRVWLYEKV